MFYKGMTITFFCILPALYSFCQKEQPKPAFSDLISNTVDSSIRSLPPKIIFSFFINGKEVKRNVKYTTHINNSIVSKQKSNSLLLKQSDLNLNDSIYFSLNYRSKTLISSKTNINNFKHGGEVIFNLIDDYKNELKKYDADSIEYINENQKSYLPRFIGTKRQKYAGMQDINFFYIVLKSNSSPLISFLDGVY
jgi:hypothetical protein